MHRARRASTHEVALFRKTVRNFYAKHGRDFPWRKTRSPYRILVSEVMLQQTQTHRVAPKYAEFIKRFPSFATLARASFRDVLSVWRGLGYNRRALALQT
ncbi:MAG: A/G-specific adenine glycosylase, partial [Candidatus Colwellbacteria bacterium]|nr:A/G-specific adenine glycosylase [Candidatus Colwellbacteria bacterium]